MGGTGFSTRFKPLRGAKGAEASTRALYDELYAIISDNIARVAKGKAYRQVTEDFLSIAHEDGEGRDDLVSFHFRDGAGLCQASVHACNHWFQLYLAALALKKGTAPSALDAIAERHSLALNDEIDDLKTLLKTCSEPLVELRGHVFGVSGPKEDPYLVSDELDEDRIEMESLNAKERAKVLAASTKQRCECIVCVTLRKKVDLKLPKPKKEAKPKKPPKLGITTTLYADGKCRSVSDNAATALPDGVFEPPSLEELSINAPITTIPEGIARLGSLRKLRLYATKIATLPEVLTRMPSLVELEFGGGSFDAIAQLSRMPWLERLGLGRLPIAKTIDELAFSAFPKLGALKLEWLDLPTLPKSVTRATALRELEIGDATMASLPASLVDLTELESLTLWMDKLTKLPPLAKLSKLKVLSINAASLASIPEDALPASLTELTLTVEKCTALPASLARLTRLEKLTLSGAFTSLPASVGKLGALKELWLYSDTLSSIPDASLPANLVQLALCDCRALTALPNRVGDLASLVGFSAIRTGLTALPDAMRRLKSLETLHLTGTPTFQALPSWIGELRKLDFVVLSGNEALGPLPASMKRLEKLRHLDLAETPGVFPLADWIGDLPIENLYVARAGVSKEAKARLEKLLPKANIT